MRELPKVAINGKLLRADIEKRFPHTETWFISVDTGYNHQTLKDYCCKGHMTTDMLGDFCDYANKHSKQNLPAMRMEDYLV